MPHAFVIPSEVEESLDTPSIINSVFGDANHYDGC